MTRADVARISAGPFYTIAANIQHLFGCQEFFVPVYQSPFFPLLHCQTLHLHLSIPPIKTHFDFHRRLTQACPKDVYSCQKISLVSNWCDRGSPIPLWPHPFLPGPAPHYHAHLYHVSFVASASWETWWEFLFESLMTNMLPVVIWNPVSGRWQCAGAEPFPLSLHRWYWGPGRRSGPPIVFFSSNDEIIPPKHTFWIHFGLIFCSLKYSSCANCARNSERGEKSDGVKRARWTPVLMKPTIKPEP